MGADHLGGVCDQGDFLTADQSVRQVASELGLLRIDTALGSYAVANGQFPLNLPQLVPQCTEKLPHDWNAKRPFVYRPSSDSYLLYGVGMNGMDDGGRTGEFFIEGDIVFAGQ